MALIKKVSTPPPRSPPPLSLHVFFETRMKRSLNVNAPLPFLMSLQLQIQGIRSYDPYSPVTIEFYKPLTIIVGHNGSGKTVGFFCSLLGEDMWIDHPCHLNTHRQSLSACGTALFKSTQRWLIVTGSSWYDGSSQKSS